MLEWRISPWRETPKLYPCNEFATRINIIELLQEEYQMKARCLGYKKVQTILSKIYLIKIAAKNLSFLT